MRKEDPPPSGAQTDADLDKFTCLENWISDNNVNQTGQRKQLRFSMIQPVWMGH